MPAVRRDRRQRARAPPPTARPPPATRAPSPSAAPRAPTSSAVNATRPPASRTISWPAATSTARERRSVTMPSSRAAATWQSETAIAPIARSRCAVAASASAESRTQTGSADSIPSSSSLPPTRRSRAPGSSGTPLSAAPWPRRATHSSPGPKSCTKPNTTSAIVSPSATASDSAWCGSPRLAFLEPSSGSITTNTGSAASKPKSTRPRSSLTAAKRAPPACSASSRRNTAASAAASISSVRSPPSPRVPVSRARCAVVGAAASTPRNSSVAARAAPSQSGPRALTRRILRRCP